MQQTRRGVASSFKKLSRRRCFFQKNVFISKKSRVFTWERAHERAHERADRQSRKVFSETHRQILLFEASSWNREQSKKSSFFTRKKSTRKSSRKVFSETHNRQTLTEERSCFFQKNVFILVVTIKNNHRFVLLLLFAQRRSSVCTLCARSLCTFEEAFVVVVVSEED